MPTTLHISRNIFFFFFLWTFGFKHYNVVFVPWLWFLHLNLNFATKQCANSFISNQVNTTHHSRVSYASHLARLCWLKLCVAVSISWFCCLHLNSNVALQCQFLVYLLHLDSDTPLQFPFFVLFYAMQCLFLVLLLHLDSNSAMQCNVCFWLWFYTRFKLCNAVFIFVVIISYGLFSSFQEMQTLSSTIPKSNSTTKLYSKVGLKSKARVLQVWSTAQFHPQPPSMASSKPHRYPGWTSMTLA